MFIAKSFNDIHKASLHTQPSVTTYALEDTSSDDGSNVFEGTSSDDGSNDSLASSVIASPQRESHSEPNSPYCLPADGPEKLRLNLQHDFIRDHVCDGRLVLDDKLTLKDGDIVLDLGTGSGAWATDMAQHVPCGIRIQGFDISSRLFPPDSANVIFTTGNVLDLPAELESRVILAHQRLLIYAFRSHEWSTALASIKAALIPGEGALQLTEVFTPAGNPGPAQEKFHLLLSR